MPHFLAPEPLGGEQPSPTAPNMDVLAGEGSFLRLLPHLRASRSIADLNCCCPTQPCRVSFAASPFLSLPLESLSHCQHRDVGPCKLSGHASAAQLQLSTPEDQQGDIHRRGLPRLTTQHYEMVFPIPHTLLVSLFTGPASLLLQQKPLSSLHVASLSLLCPSSQLQECTHKDSLV